MKDIKFKIFASALASVLLVGCNDLDTEPLGAVVTSDQKEEVVKNDPEMVSASVTGITAMFSVYGNADRKSTRLNSSHRSQSRMPSSA